VAVGGTVTFEKIDSVGSKAAEQSTASVICAIFSYFERKWKAILSNRCQDFVKLWSGHQHPAEPVYGITIWQLPSYNGNTMKTAIDRFGRVVVPKSVRRNLGLEAGGELEIVETADAIVLRPIHRQPHLRVKDGVLVFTGDVGDARDALQRVRSERLRKAGGLE
jgi:AbrB family looped-hinge helix DNA binding protein